VHHPSNVPGLLPLSAALPDMHTSTASYINLQNLYKKQAMADAVLFRECLGQVLLEAGLESEAISGEDADEFVKHCHTLLCERGSRSKDELTAAEVGDDFRTFKPDKASYSCSVLRRLTLIRYSDGIFRVYTRHCYPSRFPPRRETSLDNRDLAGHRGGRISYSQGSNV